MVLGKEGEREGKRRRKKIGIHVPESRAMILPRSPKKRKQVSKSL